MRKRLIRAVKEPAADPDEAAFRVQILMGDPKLCGTDGIGEKAGGREQLQVFGVRIYDQDADVQSLFHRGEQVLGLCIPADVFLILLDTGPVDIVEAVADLGEVDTDTVVFRLII